MIQIIDGYCFIDSVEDLYSVPKILDETFEEFCYSFHFNPELISEACQMGFLPMAGEIDGHYLLLIKLHRRRCILEFDQLHIPKNVKKRSKHYTLTVDRDFNRCVNEINGQHWDSWFHPPLIQAYQTIQNLQEVKTNFHSIELWEEDKLVAGEVGYVVGSVYTSLSGFYNKDSAGTIQLCTTGRLLEKLGFAYWDLGMEMPYKINLGAEILLRKEFLIKHKENLNNQTNLACDGINAKEIIYGL